MANKTSALHRLARLHGIDPVYIDELGHRQVTSDESVRRLLALLGVKVGNDQAVRQAIHAAQLHPWRQVIKEAMVVHRRTRPNAFPIHLPMGSLPPASLALSLTIIDESGSEQVKRLSGKRLRVEASKRIDGVRYVRLALPFPKDLPDGYYRVHLQARAPSRQWEGTMTLVIAAEQCYLPSPQARGKKRKAKAQREERVWGLTVQLYGLRSERNWGIGDFRDLEDLITWAGRDLGAAMVGVNPLHALPPGGISPYSPSSRLFHHPLYLDVESIAEFHSRPQFEQALRRPAFQAQLGRLRQSETVDYEAVQSLKWPVFEQLYRVFRTDHLGQDTDRGKAFRRFIENRGDSLERFALFQALQESRIGRGRRGKILGWQAWPASLRHPSSPAVDKFHAAHEDRVTFYQYLEWQCDLQLQAVQSAATRAGMAIGLYKDLAVGLDPNGADAWAFQDQLGQGASIGAPPDMFSPRGQNWGLAPLHPEKIRRSGYQVFIECFRQNMRHSGLLRIDHAMGLFRLFWVPEGSEPAQGGYVYYPAQDFLGILALESHRQKVVIVGEDLGTVTTEIRKALMQAGLLSYRLLLFEKTPSGAFLPPGRYPAQAMASVTTHDLPTLHGFWIGRDIQLKEQLHLYPHASLIERDRVARDRDRQALLTALTKERLLPASFGGRPKQSSAMDDRLAGAVYAYLARTPCRLVAIPLEDLLDDIETPNLPGAPPGAYPLWRRKAGPPGTTIRDWRTNSRVQAMAQTLRVERATQP